MCQRFTKMHKTIFGKKNKHLRLMAYNAANH